MGQGNLYNLDYVSSQTVSGGTIRLKEFVGDTGATAAELEELTDGSTTTLHSHAAGASQPGGSFTANIGSDFTYGISGVAFVSSQKISGGSYKNLYMPADYIIYSGAGTGYHCIDGSDGSIVSSDLTDASIPVNYATSNIPNGGFVYIQAGHYRINNPIYLYNSYTTLKGAGLNTFIKGDITDWTATNGIVISSASRGKTANYWNRISDLRLFYMSNAVCNFIPGGASGSAHLSLENIRAEWCWNGINTQRNYFGNYTYVQARYCSGNGIIWDAKTGRGSNAKGGGVPFVGCVTTRNRGTAGIYCSGLIGASFIGCTSEKNSGNATDGWKTKGAGFYMNYCKNISFNGCYTELNGVYSYYLGSGSEFTFGQYSMDSCYGRDRRCVVDAPYTTIKSCSFNSADDTVGLEVTANGTEYFLANNYVGPSETDPSIYSGGPRLRGTYIHKGNYVSNSDIDISSISINAGKKIYGLGTDLYIETGDDIHFMPNDDVYFGKLGRSVHYARFDHVASGLRIGDGDTAPDYNLHIEGSIYGESISSQNRIHAGTYISTQTGLYSHFVSANASNLAGGLSNIVEDTTPQLGGNLGGQLTYGISGITHLSSQKISSNIIYTRNIYGVNQVRPWIKFVGDNVQIDVDGSAGGHVEFNAGGGSDQFLRIVPDPANDEPTIYGCDTANPRGIYIRANESATAPHMYLNNNDTGLFVSSNIRAYRNISSQTMQTNKMSSQAISSTSMRGIVPLTYNQSNVILYSGQSLTITTFKCPSTKRAHVYQAYCCNSGAVGVSGLAIEMLAGTSTPLVGSDSVYKTSSQVILEGNPLAQSDTGDFIEIRIMYSGSDLIGELGSQLEYANGMMQIGVY